MFAAETAYKPAGSTGSPQAGGDKGRTDEEKRKRLAAAESTGGSAARPAAAGSRQASRIEEARPGEAIDEEDADAEFDRLAGERTGAKA